MYNIPEADTVIRGPLRYQGFPEFIKVLVDIGFLKDEESELWLSPIAWNEATAKLVGAKSTSEADITAAIVSKATFKDADDQKRILAGLKWLGLFSDKQITP